MVGPSPSDLDAAVKHPRDVEARSSGIARLVADYVRVQCDELTDDDLRLRQGPRAVHRTRVAVRRLRSTVRTFAPVFDEASGSALDRELAWYAGVLGRLRDVDVVGRTVDQDCARLELRPDRGAEGLRGILRAEREGAWHELGTVMDGRRYQELLRQLRAWREAPPLVPQRALEGSARDRSVATYVRRARKQADRRLARALRTDDDPLRSVDAHDVRGVAFHRARKAAKRARYAAELASPELGTRATRAARSYRKRQDVLGAMQDHQLVAEHLRALASHDDTTPDVASVCELLLRQHLDAHARLQAGWR